MRQHLNVCRGLKLATLLVVLGHIKVCLGLLFLILVREEVRVVLLLSKDLSDDGKAVLNQVLADLLEDLVV